MLQSDNRIEKIIYENSVQASVDNTFTKMKQEKLKKEFLLLDFSSITSVCNWIIEWKNYSRDVLFEKNTILPTLRRHEYSVDKELDLASRVKSFIVCYEISKMENPEICGLQTNTVNKLVFLPDNIKNNPKN